MKNVIYYFLYHKIYEILHRIKVVLIIGFLKYHAHLLIKHLIVKYLIIKTVLIKVLTELKY